MRKLMIASAMLLAVVLVAPAWAHHPAEGIVTDEIWNMINDQLEAVGSPHLAIDFDDVMDSMGVGPDPDGNVTLQTSIVVDSQDVATYMDAIYVVFDNVSRVPSGNTGSGTAATLSVLETPLVSANTLESVEMTVITIFEPVGMGNSQDGTDPKKK
ncbi:MAG: hypothetical protein HKP21_06710 [Xanthomonadales bacterium]|nr:hypothetical protein [Gammaproteobacteria bacterium]MBT8073384.1 hypothetical protein [Gammaproteobacteria bacterium]NNK04227.1 hypothetical protein [Xanthomonadales bacterium]NNK97478.1 hypothetical protein [Xanthomonadales bacterium]